MCKEGLQFDQILLKSAPSSPSSMNYLAIISPVQFQDPQGGPRGLIMEGHLQVEKTHPRVSGFSVPDHVKQKSAFQHTWFSNNN